MDKYNVNEEMYHIASYVCSHVFENSKPILYVCREDGEWQFLCGGMHTEYELPEVVGMGHIIENDKSLFDILNLPNGFEAERDSLDAEWKINRIVNE